jgi:hypothetical protein
MQLWCTSLPEVLVVSTGDVMLDLFILQNQRKLSNLGNLLLMLMDLSHCLNFLVRLLSNKDWWQNVIKRGVRAQICGRNYQKRRKEKEGREGSRPSYTKRRRVSKSMQGVKMLELFMCLFMQCKTTDAFLADNFFVSQRHAKLSLVIPSHER